MTPVLCMVTDRHRAGGGEALARRVAAAAHAGVHLVQVRERDLEGGALFALVRACLDAVRSTRARVVVNDRLDVAVAAGAHGVHLRADSLPAMRARAMTPPGFLVGRSVHSRDEAVRAAADGGLDYLMFGTVFPTASKPGQAAAGVETLAAVVSATALPVLAIGGVTPLTAGRAAAAGAAGVAAIGLFATADDAALRVAVARTTIGFDTPATVP